MGMCQRTVVSLHYNKNLQQFYAIMRYTDGEPGQFTQQFSQELFFGWYTLLEQEALRQGKTVQTTLTDGIVTNWIIVTTVTVVNLSPLEMSVANDAGQAIYLNSLATGTLGKVTDGSGYIVTGIASPNGTPGTWTTKKDGVVVETDTLSFDNGIGGFSPNDYEYDTIEIDVNPILIAAVSMVGNPNLGLNLVITPTNGAGFPENTSGVMVLSTNTTEVANAGFYLLTVPEATASFAGVTVLVMRTFLLGSLQEEIDVSGLITSGNEPGIPVTVKPFDQIVFVCDPVYGH